MILFFFPHMFLFCFVFFIYFLCCLDFLCYVIYIYYIYLFVQGLYQNSLFDESSCSVFFLVLFGIKLNQILEHVIYLENFYF